MAYLYAAKSACQYSGEASQNSRERESEVSCVRGDKKGLLRVVLRSEGCVEKLALNSNAATFQMQPNFHRQCVGRGPSKQANECVLQKPLFRKSILPIKMFITWGLFSYPALARARIHTT